MNKNEAIRLLDDLAIAGTNCELAINNLKKWGKMYDELLNKFNNNIGKLGEEILSDSEFMKKVEKVKDIFNSLETEKNR